MGELSQERSPQETDCCQPKLLRQDALTRTLEQESGGDPRAQSGEGTCPGHTVAEPILEAKVLDACLSFLYPTASVSLSVC